MILQRRIDTRSDKEDALGLPVLTYSGDDVARWLGALVADAASGGYESWELTWWDYCEGWVTMRGPVPA